MFIIKEGTPADKVGEGTDKQTLESIAKYLEKTGHVVRTQEQEKQFVEAQTQQEVNKVLGERNAQFEATILETTGIPKSQGEKFYEYHKRALTEKLNEVTTLKAKITEFETKGLQGSELAKQYKTELENAQKQIKTLNDEWEKKLNDKDTEVFTTRVNTEVEKVVAEIRGQLDPTIKPELVEDVIQARLNRFHAENKPKKLGDVTVWQDAQGVTRTSKKDGKPEAAKDILVSNYFADLIDKGRQQGGAGSGDGKGGNPDKPTPKWKEIQLPSTVTSQIKLTDFLMKEAKLDPSTKDYSEAFENLKGDLPLK